MENEISILEENSIRSKIHVIRGQQVMLDRDLAELYGVETKVLNQAVKRNKEWFPEEFCFQLTKEEVEKDFDYGEFVKKIDELQAQERKIKTLLAYSNATTKLVGIEDLTIGEGLVKLAQLNSKLRTLAGYKTTKQVVKTVKHATFEGDKDRVYVTEYLYDPKNVDEDIKSLQREISHLQVAIDRTNLTNMIEC